MAESRQDFHVQFKNTRGVWKLFNQGRYTQITARQTCKTINEDFGLAARVVCACCGHIKVDFPVVTETELDN